MRFSPLGDSAVVAELGGDISSATLQRMRNFTAVVMRAGLPGIFDIVPAFVTVAVFYDPTKWTVSSDTPHNQICRELERLAALEAPLNLAAGREIVVPVCYGGELGPDLSTMAAQAGLSEAEVIKIHSEAPYLVHAIGFSPGFPYLGGLPEKLHTPRRATPRTSVSAGSVGIGGAQTGIYPVETPGGWQLIGRTPLQLFEPARTPPALLQVGDRVRFQPVPQGSFTRAGSSSLKHCHPLDDKSSAARATGAGEVCHPLDDKPVGVRVVRAGMLTTVQDLGRRGHRAEGVPLSGAADPLALRLVNWLVGNAADAPALEFTLVGPELEFSADAVIALGGAAFTDLPCWHPVYVTAGSRINLESARGGCRGYLAVAGGFKIANVLGSASTYLRGGWGGFQGRALRDDDVLPIAAGARRITGRWHIDERILPHYSATPTVRITRGAQAGDFFAPLVEAEFTVTPRSDRMGLRLSGAPLFGQGTAKELLSTAVVPGTIQVPPDGQPIVLLADAQTIGGYPQAAQVITVDLPLLAQLRSGDRVRFREVSGEEAQKLLLVREHVLAILHEGLVQKFT